MAMTPERRAAISAAMKGRPKSSEHRAALSVAQVRRFSDPDQRAAMRTQALNQWADPAMRAHMASVVGSKPGVPKTPEHRAAAAAAQIRHGEARLGRLTRLYVIWRGIRQRTRDPRVASYPRYGGRGITVCDEWLRYEPFRDWARASGYADDLTIDRIDNDGNYEPANCRWITRSENSRRRWASKES